mmetsp:Transcript_24431/g.41525  ORF Transcript_24431/g.41525 Transcript_24431/m.41525 type:complete len:89 (+) Transcript_24431:1011-1277(+)
MVRTCQLIGHTSNLQFHNNKLTYFFQEEEVAMGNPSMEPPMQETRNQKQKLGKNIWKNHFFECHLEGVKKKKLGFSSRILTVEGLNPS